MKHVKYFSLILALLLTVGIFTACSKFEYDNSTVLAKVSSIEGQKVVFLVGEMDLGGGVKPEDFGGGMRDIPDFGGERPNLEDLPEGEFPSGFEGMQKPEGEPPEDFSGMQIPNGQLPGGFGDMQMPFKENGETITLTLNEETVKTLSVGNIVQIIFGDNGNVEALIALDEVMGGGRDFSGSERGENSDDASKGNIPSFPSGFSGGQMS